jgi:CRP-like cAMP-binding protein
LIEATVPGIDKAMADDEDDPLACLNDTERSFLTRIVATKILPTLEALARGGTAFAFEQWLQVIQEQKEIEAAIALEKEVKRIMRDSVRGERTVSEKESLKKYLIKLACIPTEVVTATAMDTLCNEIDSVSTVGKSILFLQGDFGNVYYMIAKGEVGLYLEKSKDREMELEREFGSMRGVSYEGSLHSLDALGTHIATLREGQGFGEFAILSQTGKLRMCAAVATTDESFLFVLHASTYNAVLRQHHYRSKQLSEVTQLLQELPIFNLYSYSKLSNAAYAMKSTLYSNGSVIIKPGQQITHALIVNKGQVKVLHSAPKLVPEEDTLLNTQDTWQNRLPNLAHAILGKGSIIGQRELQSGSGYKKEFTMTYVSCSRDCEVFEMPINLYREMCLAPEILELDKVKKLNNHFEERDENYKARIGRTTDTIRNITLSGARNIDAKDQLVRLLPLLIDGVSLDGAGLKTAADGNTYKNNGNRFSKNTTAADIIEIAGKSEWFDGTGVSYGYDPSVSREENMSTSDLFAKTQPVGMKTQSPIREGRQGPQTPTRPGDARGNSRSMRVTTPGKSKIFSPSPRAAKISYASTLSAPNTPRAPTTPR